MKNFKNTQNLLEWMKGIKYGWVDKDGKKHFNSSDQYFYFDYLLQLPNELLKNKVGICWDQTIFEKYIFDNIFKIENKMIFIQQYKVSTHTFLVFKKKE